MSASICFLHIKEKHYSNRVQSVSRDRLESKESGRDKGGIGLDGMGAGVAGSISDVLEIGSSGWNGSMGEVLSRILKWE